MEFRDLFRLGRVEDFYNNPDSVLISFFLLTFLLVSYVLFRLDTFRGNRTNKGVIFLISFIISTISAFYLRDTVSYLLTSFNILVYLLVVTVFFVMAKPFFRFLKKQF